MSPIAVVAAGPYNFFYSLAVAVAATAMLVAGRRRGWNAVRWATIVGVWVTAGVLGAMVPHAILGDAAAYRTAIGGVMLSTIALALLAPLVRRSPAEVLDTTAVAIPLGAAVVRIGCFLGECCQGIATSLPIGIALHPDDVPRHPVQLYESALELALAITMARRTEASRPGRRFAATIGGMSAIRFVTEFVRDNDKHAGLSLAQWVVLPVGALCIALLLSRPGARRPHRVLTTQARLATTACIGGLGIIAIAIGLPALESSVLLLGVAVITAAFVRRLGRAAPTGLAVIMLQMPAISGDTAYPRAYTFFGGGFTGGSYDYRHLQSTCDGPSEDWTRHHSFTGLALEAGTRTEYTETKARGFRVSGFAESEQVGAARVVSGTPSQPGAHSRNSGGFSVIGDFDWRFFGVSAGGSLGGFHPMFEGTSEDAVPFMPAIGLRIGPQRGVAVEMRFGDETPSWAPGTLSTAALALGDRQGNRFRFGVSEAGVFLAGRHITSSGLELMPSVVLGHSSAYDVSNAFQASIGIRKWVRASPRPRDER